MTERIKIQVDDIELDRFIIKLDRVLQRAGQVFGGAPGASLTRKMTTAERDLASLAFAFSKFDDEQLAMLEDPTRLPGISREMRIIFGQIPGMREAMRIYFNLKRLMRGVGAGEGAAILAISASLLVGVQAILSMQKKQERELEFLRTAFGDYFEDRDELSRFAIENRVTELEGFKEWWLGLWSRYSWEDLQRIVAGVPLEP